MLFIHHYQDSEREEKPPPEIRRVARRTYYEAGPIAAANIRVYVPTDKPQMDHVRTSSADCGSDYWEIVIEDGDL